MCLTERTTANGHLRRMSSHERCSGGGDELQICRVQCPCGKQGEDGKANGRGRRAGIGNAGGDGYDDGGEGRGKARTVVGGQEYVR